MTLFDNFKNNTRLLIIHPNYHQQKHTLAELLEIESLVYVRFDGNQLTYDDLNEQLYSAYQKSAIPEIDLVALDECDRAKKGDFNGFLRDLLSHIKPTPIILFSRDLPSLVLDDAAIASISAIWPTNPKLMYPDYLAKNHQNILEAFALGQGYIRVNGVKFDDWRDKQSQELFFFLIDKDRIHREEIFEAFWPHLDAKGAATAFQNVKLYLNNQLGFDMTDYHDGYYSISSAIEVYYDVEQYRELIQKADFTHAVIADKLYHEANSLYSGNFLRDIESQWVDEQREKVKASQTDVLANIARQEIRAGHPESALVYWGRAAHFAPQREDIAHQLVLLYLQSGMPCEALTAYNRLYRSLATYNLKPNQTIEVLAEEAHQQCSNL